MDQRGTQADHDRAQHDHAHDSPEQHLVLVLPWNGQEAEDHRHEEHVVHRQRFLDEKAREVIHAGVAALLEKHPQAEQQAGADVAPGQQQTLAHADFAIFAMQHAEVEGQQGNYYSDEDQPQPGGRAEEVGEEERF
ncbi:hypothetical protein D9M73_262710 [compost metagenome]